MHFSRNSRGPEKLALKKASTIAAIWGVCCIDFFIVYKMFTNFDSLLDMMCNKFFFRDKRTTHRYFRCVVLRNAYLFFYV